MKKRLVSMSVVYLHARGPSQISCGRWIASIEGGHRLFENDPKTAPTVSKTLIDLQKAELVNYTTLYVDGGCKAW